MTLTEYMQSARTLSQAEVDHRVAVHDMNDLRPEERASFDTASMHKIEVVR